MRQKLGSGEGRSAIGITGIVILATVVGLIVSVIPAAAWNGNFVLRDSEAWSAVGDVSAAAVASRDVDADGIVELVTVGSSSNGVSTFGELRIWSWSGGGLALERAHTWGSTGDTVAVSVALGDVDADSAVEIVVVGTRTTTSGWFGQLTIWNWQGGVLTQELLYETSPPTSVHEFTDVAVAQLDADALLEIAVVGTRAIAVTIQYGFLRMYEWNGVVLVQTQGTEWNVSPPSLVEVNGITIEDVDEDEVREIVTVGELLAAGPLWLGDIRIWNVQGGTLNAEVVATLVMPPGPAGDVFVGEVLAGLVDLDAAMEILTCGKTAVTSQPSKGDLVAWKWNGVTMAMESRSSWQYGTDSAACGGVALGRLDSVLPDEILVASNRVGGFSQANLTAWNYNGVTLRADHDIQWAGSGTAVLDVALADIDADLILDILTAGAQLASRWQGQLRVWAWAATYTDADLDGLTDFEETFLRGTSPNSPDSEGDGVGDAIEIRGPAGSDPESWWVPLNPLASDSDVDGLTDGAEFNTYKTLGWRADTDGDGSLDLAEISFWLARGKTADQAGANARRLDVDGDGMRDGREIQYWPTLNPEVADAGGDPDGDTVTNANEVNLYNSNPSLSQTYNRLDNVRKRMLDDVGLNFNDDIYVNGYTENVYMDIFEITAPNGIVDPYFGDPSQPTRGRFSVHTDHSNAAAGFSVTVRAYDRTSGLDDTGDYLHIPWIEMKDQSGNPVAFSVSQTGATYTITTTAAVPVGDYTTIWSFYEDGDGSTMRVTSTDKIHFVCPDPKVGTYPVYLRFVNEVAAKDLYFTGHTQNAGYIGNLFLNVVTQITTTTTLGNPLYVNSEFSYFLGLLAVGTHTLDFNWVVTGTSAAMEFKVSTVGWQNPCNNDLDLDDVTDCDEADLFWDPEIPDHGIEVDYEPGQQPPAARLNSIEAILEFPALPAAVYGPNVHAVVHILLDEQTTDMALDCFGAPIDNAETTWHDNVRSHTWLFWANDDTATDCVGSASITHGTAVFEGDVQWIAGLWTLDATDTERLRLNVAVHELGHTMDAGIADDVFGEVREGQHGEATPPPNRITRGDPNPHWSIMAGGTNRACDHSTPPGTCRPYGFYDAANGGITEVGGAPVSDNPIYSDEDLGTVHLDNRWSVD